MTVVAEKYEDTVETVVEALRDLGVDDVEITSRSQLREDLDVDSAELVELVAQIIGRAPDGKALKNVRTVSDLAGFLAR